jgi:hypothetical protein
MPEGEMVIGIEPTEIGLAQAFKGTEFDHGLFRMAACGLVALGGDTRRAAPYRPRKAVMR